MKIVVFHIKDFGDLDKMKLSTNIDNFIGSLEPKSLRKFLFELHDQIDHDIEIGLGELPISGVSLSYKQFDVSAVKDDIGIVPQVSFAEGIRRTIEWIRAGEN